VYLVTLYFVSLGDAKDPQIPWFTARIVAGLAWCDHRFDYDYS